MTEAEARQWLRDEYGVSRETSLAELVRLVLAESEHQNLISRATVDAIWTRHIVDSAQLLQLAGDHREAGLWVDIGTGAGFPGLVVALLRQPAPVLLVEPRRRRADFLTGCVKALNLDNSVEVAATKVENVDGPPATVISARAVAALPKLFAGARQLSNRDTIWLLPKGSSAQSEVEAARKAWQGSFHVEQSMTHPESFIVVAKGVRAR